MVAVAPPSRAAQDAVLSVGLQVLTAQPVPPGSPITVSLLYACSSLTAPSCTDVRIDIPRPTGQPGNIAITMTGPYTDPSGLHYANPSYPSGTTSAFDFTITTPPGTPDGTTLTLVATGTASNSPTQTVSTTIRIGFTPPGRFHPLTPTRIADTRSGFGGLPRLSSSGVQSMQLTGRGGVPDTGVGAVVMNVTVTEPTASGFLTVFPVGNPAPLAANLNFTPGQTVPNLVVAKVGGNGAVAFSLSAGTAHLVLDVAGWYSDTAAGADGRYSALTPARILDTRDGNGGVRLGPGASLDLQVSSRGGVPASGAAAAVLNLAATGTTATSFLTVYPTGAARPLAANLNFNGGDTVSNRAMVKLGAGGKVTIYNNAGSADVIVDVGGWYTDAASSAVNGTYVPLVPARILDTRNGGGGTVAAGTTIEVQVSGQGGIPAAGASAVILNATVTLPAAPGWLTMFPTGTARPLASDLNYTTGETRPNLVIVRVGAGGRVSLYMSAAGHVVLDTAGWFS
ncbi:MAG: hypothetical protein ACR2KK_17025 [Acidimicrobiales bacterium]